MEGLKDKITEAVNILTERSRISNIMVGLSGGKDSLCLCQLVKMAGIKNVGYFHMDFLPNLRVEDDFLRYPCERFGIDIESIERVQSEHFYKCMRYSLYTWYSKSAKKDFPNISRTEIYNFIGRKHNATVATGVKIADSMQMERMVTLNRGTCIYPIKHWNMKDVFAFMNEYKIGIPPLTKMGVRGVGLDQYDLHMIEKYYPDDLEKIEEIFPFCRALILPYKYFGLKESVRLA